MRGKKEKFYAIKRGKNLIVNSWEECKKYVLMCPSVYEIFDKKREAERYLYNISEECADLFLEFYRMEEIKNKKNELEKILGFEMPLYVAEELITGDSYQDLCILLNMANLNNRLTRENIDVIREIFKIKFEYETDRFKISV